MGRRKDTQSEVMCVINVVIRLDSFIVIFLLHNPNSINRQTWTMPS